MDYPALTPLRFGALAPNFKLQSTSGHPFTREQFRAKNGLLMVFFPTPADARIEPLLREIAASLPAYEQINVRVLAITTSDPDLTDLPFSVLLDPDSSVWRAYSLRQSTMGYALFILDTYGGVDSQRVGENFDVLPDAQTMLDWTTSTQYRCNI